MRKLISLVLTFTLLSQTLLVPSLSSEALAKEDTQATNIYNYDSTGNLTFDSKRSITWDASGMPSSITKGNTVVNFIYDGSGQRIGKIVKVDGKLQSSTIYFGNLEKEMAYNTSGQATSTTVTKYYFAGGKRIALRKDNGDPVYLHKDHLSSSTLFTDSSGNKKGSLLTYYPYGSDRQNWDMPVPSTTPPATNHLYTNQIKDPETDLYYYNARYYSPQTGLFISADTAGDSLNKYAYANNNPVMFSDPSGHFPFIIIPLIALGLFILTTPMACDTSVGPAQMTPEQSEFSVNTVKMMNPVFALSLSAVELNRHKKLGSERPITNNVEKSLLYADVVFSGVNLASGIGGNINTIVNTARASKVEGFSDLMKAKTYNEVTDVVNKYATGVTMTEKVVDESSGSYQLLGTVRIGPNGERTLTMHRTATGTIKLSAAKHEALHILLDHGRTTIPDAIVKENAVYSIIDYPYMNLGQQVGSALQSVGHSTGYPIILNTGTIIYSADILNSGFRIANEEIMTGLGFEFNKNKNIAE